MEVQGIVPSAEDVQRMNDVSIEIAADEANEYLVRMAVLKTVKSMVTEEVFLDIEQAMADSYNREFKIVDQPLGQAEDQGYCFGDIYIDQTTCGGFCGDDFAGTIGIPLPNGKFFQFCYSM